jgi:DNA gyrase subunit A
MKRFELDAEQTDAILELKLYRLARLEILVIQNELAEKRKRARQIPRCSRTRRPLEASCATRLEEIQKSTRQGDARTLIEADEESHSPPTTSSSRRTTSSSSRATAG